VTTAIDSSVLFAVIKGEADAPAWTSALVEAAAEGFLLISPIVYAELAAGFSDIALLDAELARLNILYSPIEQPAAFAAGQIFRTYRQAGGPRLHMIPDFLVAAHALHQADRLAAIDRGYLRAYFPTLRLLETDAAV
jgi:predicted nucleic acid-binding protein